MQVEIANPASPAPRISSRPKYGLWIAIMAMAAALPYLHTLSYGFVFDDAPQIVNNPDLSIRNIPRFFDQPIAKLVGFHGDSLPVFYRPLFFTQLALTRTLFGSGPFGFHLVSLLLHIANTLLLFLLALRLGMDWRISCLASLIFAVHPVHVESVVWPSASPEVMVLAAILCSLLAFVEFTQRYSSSHLRYFWLVASLVAFLAGLFVKETAIVTVALVAALTVFPSSRPDRPFLRCVLNIVPYLAVTLFYCLIRSRVLRGWLAVVTPTSFADMARTWPGALWFYERHLIFPAHTSVIYDYDLVEHLTWPDFWLPFLAVLVTAVVWGFFLRFRHSVAALIATLLVILPIVLVLNFRVFYWRDLVHDRYLYTPSAGFCLLVAMALWEFSLRSVKVVRPSIQAVLLAGLLCVLALTSVTETLPWKNNLLLMRNAVAVAPTNIAAEKLLGNELETTGRIEEAQVAYGRALQITPSWGPAWFDYGRILLLSQDPTNSIRCLRRAIQLDDVPIERVWLALALESAGQPQQAQIALAEATAADPSMQQTYAVLRRKLVSSAQN